MPIEMGEIPLDDPGDITECSNAAGKTDHSDGIQLKTDVRDQVKHLHGKAWRQLAQALLRNLLCYMFLCSLIAVISAGYDLPRWLEDSRVTAIIIMCLSFVGIPFQIIHAVRETRNKTPSLLGSMLMTSRFTRDLEDLLNFRLSSAPRIVLEVKAKSGLLFPGAEPEHWSRTSRKCNRVLSYQSWWDSSKDVQNALPKDKGRAFWIIVAKDYRAADSSTQKSIASDIRSFKKETSYSDHMYLMSFEHILDLEEGDFFPDAQAFLVFFGDDHPKFYSHKLYMGLTYAALDGFYSAVFHCMTRNMPDYYITKFMLR